SALASASSGALANGQTRFDFAAFALAQGLDYLQATYTDGFGNVVVSDRVLYSVDAVGPSLTLGVRTAAGAVQGCGTLGTSCLADTLPFDSSTRRIRLDKLAANPTCGGFGPCSPDGTDLFFTLAQCVNSDASLETCPVVVRLQSRLPGELDWTDVFAGTFSSGDVADASIYAGPEFEPGTVRELRLVTEDTNHNPGVSNSAFVTLNFAGVLVVSVERLDAALGSTGDLLDDDRYYGIAEDVLDPTSGRFQTNFVATLDAYGVSPTTVRLSVDNAGGSTAYEAPIGSPIAGVELEVATNPASPSTNAVTVEAMCGPDVCGTRAYGGIVADIQAPTYEFDRCSLCANAVPMVSIACPAACGDATAASNIAGPGNPAIWNLAQDADHDGTNGFNAQPVVLSLSGIEDGRALSLETDLGSLGGNVLPSDGCAGAPACAKVFTLTASHLPGTAVRRISVSFSDRAGNPAVPRPVRVDSARESIYARTDVIAPAGVQASACIGESTPPVSGFDAATIEAPACVAACSATGACSRTEASAALTWSAPGDDASSGNVVSYTIGIAALGIPYGATTYASCAELTPAGPFETTAVLPGAPQSGGATELVAVPELYPHRDYCFLVVATDDVGNSGPTAGFVSRRKIPLVTAPAIQPFDGIVRDDAQAVGAFRGEPASPPDYGAFATSLPDLDGDGRDDFAVTQLTSGSVQVFLSSSAAFAPAVTINAPAIAYSGSFGAAVAGGDFDGDGLNDLVICDPTLLTSGFPQAGAAGGALFLYYGVLGDGIARNINTTTPQVPSLHPDVSLLGAAGQRLCANVAFGDVIGDVSVDLVLTTSTTSPDPRAYIIGGGDRGKLPLGQSYFDLAPDVLIAPEPSALGWPRRLALGDYDGDGVDELAISDDSQVFTYDGGAFTTVVTYEPSATGFGNQLATVRSPRGTTGDWLLVGTTDDRVVVFATGFMSASYPLASYVTLDGTGWNGTPAARFGQSIASIGDFDGRGGIDIVVGPGTTSSGGPYNTFLFSFDADADAFEKRAILQGGPGFASTLAGVRAYTPGSALDRSQLLVVQRFAARLFMFR
ncbi:MAG: FG-GAP-like repeat-containing protein, partial [Myxococcota bacterium]